MKKTFIISIKNILILFIFFLIIIFSIFCKNHIKKYNKRKSQHKNYDEFPYRVISALDSNHYLIAYEFHSSADNGDPYKRFSAIIKKIDPAKDAYKNYCKSIISDIVKTIGFNGIEINIYDDYYAYYLLEIEYTLNNKVLNKSESDSINRHLIATYYGSINNENYNIIYFYLEAHNLYTEREKYNPI